MLPQQYTPPPPQPVPAEVQTINAAHAQRLASPGQSIINDVNSGKYGKGFTASMPSPSSQARELNQSMEGIGKGIGALGAARSKGETARARDNAARGPGYTERPTNPPSANKGIESIRAKAANGHAANSRNATQASSNKGIETTRQNAAAKQSGENASLSGKSTNKGISNYQNGANGQASSTSKGVSSSATKGTSANIGSSADASSAGKSSGSSGQTR